MDISIYNLVFAIVVGLLFQSVKYAGIMLVSFGFLASVLVWFYMKKSQRYMYSNIGFTMRALLAYSYLLTVVIVLLLFPLLLIVEA